MSNKRRRRRENPAHRRLPVGTAPGTLVADPAARATTLRVIAYGPRGCVERSETDPAAVRAYRDEWPNVWVDVVGLGDVDIIRGVGEQFGLHLLALEDVLNPHQRPKLEDFESYRFLVARAIHGGDSLRTEQLCLFLGNGYLITFQEDAQDCFDPIRKRITAREPGILGRGADYLMYCILDAVVDAYFPPLEDLGERLDVVESHILTRADQQTMAQVYGVKRELLTLRRAVWPLREAVNALIRDTSALTSDGVRVYLRDCYDHIVRLMEIVELSREVCADLMDLYVSAVSNRLNEVMKVLTIIATVFIPLTFVTGIYGMNFNTERSPWNMPELNWPYGYLFALTLMLLIAMLMVVFFWRRGWIGPPREGGHPEVDDW